MLRQGALAFSVVGRCAENMDLKQRSHPPIQQNEIFYWMLWSLVVSLHGFGLGTLSPDLQSRDGVGGEENIFPSFVSKAFTSTPVCLAAAALLLEYY